MPEEIVTSWTHTINGQVAKVDRGKPALLPTAVPSRNIDNQQELMQKVSISVIRTFNEHYKTIETFSRIITLKKIGQEVHTGKERQIQKNNPLIAQVKSGKLS